MFAIVAHHVTRTGRKHLAQSCWDLSGLVRTCREFVGTCQEVVGTCQELSGGIGNVDFMESHFEGIAIVVNIISAEFPIP